MTLQIFQTAERVRTLGPFIRFGLWVQGCPRRCPCCVSPEARDPAGGYAQPVADLARAILTVPDIEGLTISGGEPYSQEAALCELLGRLRPQRDLGVILYTGWTYPEVEARPLTALCDAIIDGPYIRELDDSRSLRGSSNQRLIHVTDRYRETLYIGGLGRETELISNREGGVSVVGVPSARDLARTRRLRGFWGGKPYE